MGVATGRSFTFKGVDFAHADRDLAIQDFDAPMRGRPKFDTRKLSAAPGSVTQGITYESFSIHLECVIVADQDEEDPRANYLAKLASVAANLDPADAEQTLILNAHGNRSYTARLQRFDVTDEFPNGCYLSIDFFVPSGDFTEV